MFVNKYHLFVNRREKNAYTFSLRAFTPVCWLTRTLFKVLPFKPRYTLLPSYNNNNYSGLIWCSLLLIMTNSIQCRQPVIKHFKATKGLISSRCCFAELCRRLECNEAVNNLLTKAHTAESPIYKQTHCWLKSVTAFNCYPGLIFSLLQRANNCQKW